MTDRRARWPLTTLRRLPHVAARTRAMHSAMVVLPLLFATSPHAHTDDSPTIVDDANDNIDENVHDENVHDDTANANDNIDDENVHDDTANVHDDNTNDTRTFAPVDAARESSVDDDAFDVDLPDALPPLDDDLQSLLDDPFAGLAHPFGGASLLASGRIRLELDEGRDGDAAPDLQAGLSLTGRVGADIPLLTHRARVVLGEGRRFGRDDGNLTVPFVGRHAADFLYEMYVALDVPMLGVPTSLIVGRQEIIVGDGRLVGRAPFDPRGRTFDGVVARALVDNFDVVTGAIYLGPYTATDDLAPRVLGFFEVKATLRELDGSAYALVERGPNPLDTVATRTTPTLGGRGNFAWRFLTANGGVDAQTAFDDGALTAPRGFSLHGQMSVEAAPTFTMFDVQGAPVVGVHLESTGTAFSDVGFRAPHGDVHAPLGNLDLVAMDNVSDAALYVGVTLPEKARFDVAVRGLFLTDPSRGAVDPLGRVVTASNPDRSNRHLFTEVDARLFIDVGAGLAVVGEYGIAFPGADVARDVPTQRLLVSLAFQTEKAAMVGNASSPRHSR